MTGLTDLTALAARERLGSGALSAVELTQACLGRIAERDAEVHAWAFLDRQFALSQAGALDAHRQSGRPVGALHGLPVGIKDIIDTRDLPTENGNALDAGRQPEEDAGIVARLRAAGATVLGKTVTTECAYLAPAGTRNPHALEHTPGGSSSGSAAAVASGMVPMAIGTQTGGSVIRPAAFCGIVGFKPTFGLIPRSGVLRTSRTFFQIWARWFISSFDNSATSTPSASGPCMFTQLTPLIGEMLPRCRGRLATLAFSGSTLSRLPIRETSPM